MAKQLTPFEKEFAAARDRYKKDKGTNPLDPKYNFDFNGKKYNVEYAEEKQARKGGKSSSAAPSKSSKSSDSSAPAASKPTGAPVKDRSKMTYEQMMEAGKNDELVKQNEQEREDDWSKAKEKAAGLALAAASIIPAGRLAKGVYSVGKKLFGAARGATKGANTARNATRSATTATKAEMEAGQAAAKANRAAAKEAKAAGNTPSYKNTTSPATSLTEEQMATVKANRAAAQGRKGAANYAGAMRRAGEEAATKRRGIEGAADYAGAMRKAGEEAATKRRGIEGAANYAGAMRNAGEEAAMARNAASRGAAQKAKTGTKDPLKMSPRTLNRKGEITTGEVDQMEAGYKKGGKVKFGKNKPFKASSAGESPAMVKKEMAFMRKKGAPKFMMKHEKKEAMGMKKMAAGGMAKGGMAKGGMSCMKRGGGVKKYAAGGMVSRGDGLSRVKTRCKVC